MLSAALLLTTTSLQAQLDSRNRTVETIIIDNLGQLPAKDAKQICAVDERNCRHG